MMIWPCPGTGTGTEIGFSTSGPPGARRFPWQACCGKGSFLSRPFQPFGPTRKRIRQSWRANGFKNLAGTGHPRLSERIFPETRLQLLDLHHLIKSAGPGNPRWPAGRTIRPPANTAPLPHRPPKASRAWCTSSDRARYRPTPSRSGPPCPRSPLPRRRHGSAREKSVVPRRTNSRSAKLQPGLDRSAAIRSRKRRADRSIAASRATISASPRA